MPKGRKKQITEGPYGICLCFIPVQLIKEEKC